MDRSNNRKMKIGWASVGFLVASWALFWLPHPTLSHTWDQWLYVLAILLSGPAAIISAVVAGRRSSKWWYIVAAGGFLTFTVLVVGLAV
jgi:hypothetical protein